MIKFVCVGCGERLSVPDQYAGRKGACPNCHAVNRVPLKGLAANAAAPAARAPSAAPQPPARGAAPVVPPAVESPAPVPPPVAPVAIAPEVTVAEIKAPVVYSSVTPTPATPPATAPRPPTRFAPRVESARTLRAGGPPRQGNRKMLYFVLSVLALVGLIWLFFYLLLHVVVPLLS